MNNVVVAMLRTLQAMLDYRTDYKLYATCKDDVKNLCSDADPGQEIECLVSGLSVWMGMGMH